MAVKKQTTAVANWESELADMATEVAKMEEGHASGGSFLSAKGGRFSYKDNVIGDTITVVVVDHVLENHFYENGYDPDVVQAPVCFSFGRSEEEMVPHPESVSPQCSSCKECPNNQYGTSNTGKGKACKNVRRLALLLEDSLDDVEGGEVAYFKIPVTSVKAWASYVQQISTVLKRPPLGVVTEISIVPDNKTQFKIQFSVTDKISDGGLVKQLIAKKAAIENDLTRPYKQQEAEEPKPKAKKTAAKRKY